MTLVRRLSAAALGASLVLTGAFLAPAQAADDLRTRSAPPGFLETAPADLPTRAVVDDPAGDVETEPAHLGRLIDLRRVTYRTPARTDGTMTVRATWQELRNGNRPGVRRQLLVTVIEDPGGRTWFLEVDNRRDSFRLVELRDEEPHAVRVRPETVEVQRRPGARGRTTVTLSTEWLPARRVALTTYAAFGGESLAFDATRPQRLRVGPRR